MDKLTADMVGIVVNINRPIVEYVPRTVELLARKRELERAVSAEERQEKERLKAIDKIRSTCLHEREALGRRVAAGELTPAAAAKELHRIVKEPARDTEATTYFDLRIVNREVREAFADEISAAWPKLQARFAELVSAFETTPSDREASPLASSIEGLWLVAEHLRRAGALPTLRDAHPDEFRWAKPRSVPSRMTHMGGRITLVAWLRMAIQQGAGPTLAGVDEVHARRAKDAEVESAKRAKRSAGRVPMYTGGKYHDTYAEIKQIVADAKAAEPEVFA